MSDLIAGNDVDWIKASISFGIGFLSGAISGAGAKNQKALKKFARKVNPKISSYEKTISRMTHKLSISSMKARVARAIAAEANSYANATIGKMLNVLIFSSGINGLFNNIYSGLSL